MSIFAAAVATLFQSPLAVDGIYKAGVQEIPVRVIQKSEDDIASVQGIEVIQRSIAFDIQAAEVINPKKGDFLTVNGKEYKVRTVLSEDPDQLIWTIFP